MLALVLGVEFADFGTGVYHFSATLSVSGLRHKKPHPYAPKLKGPEPKNREL